jgi:chromosome segregation ATPase
MRRTGEDGLAVVAVPAEEVHARRARAPVSGHPISGDGQDDSPRVMIGALQATIAVLRERTEAAEKRAEQAQVRAEQAETRAGRAEQGREGAENRAGRTEQYLDAERTRTDALKNELKAVLAQLATIRAEINATTNRERAIGEAAGRLREQLAATEGLVEAERARAERAERDWQKLRDVEARVSRELAVARQRTEQAEKGRDGERARADALRDRLAIIMQAQHVAAEEDAAGTPWRAAEASIGPRTANPVDDLAGGRGLVARLRTALRGPG